jgi:primosomal replication protein N''
VTRLPGPDVNVESGTAEITAAAVLFHVSFAGQAIVEDIRHLRSIPPAGTGLETMLRIKDGASHLPDIAAQHDDDLDRYATAESDPTRDLAVLKARSGPGLVIEGPPGTGKSQTIGSPMPSAGGEAF